ncbi:F-box protein [Corchorus olitorius]|uniref:F-box protein n=1 Tax=Corchorus olitorius TaxID=93759 RepID=A0A1R3HP80_9ROSI|nr:F-box protein [Corchorus olitorius]
MRAVCKAWSAPTPHIPFPPHIPVINNFPWAMRFQWHPTYNVHAAYAGGGTFYCVFSGGQLGAFDVELKEWTMLTMERLPDFNFGFGRLIVSNGDLLLMGGAYAYQYTETLKLLKFDFSEKCWVRQTSLNDRVLFIGCTCFSCPAVGETSQLANNGFSCCGDVRRFFGVKSDSKQYENWALAAASADLWIEFPSSCIWRANDLMTAG